MSIRAALDLMLSIQKRDMTISRPGTALTGPVTVSPSNYFRNLSGPEQITIEGKEFVIPKSSLDSISYPVPKKGDRLTDPEIGVSVISEIREMFDVGGAIIAYRIRCN